MTLRRGQAMTVPGKPMTAAGGQPPAGSRWQPLAVSQVAALFAAAPAPWWIAGGHAIELFTGLHRPHKDIDVLMLHRDQAVVHSVLDGWDCHVADPPGVGTLRPWRVGEVLA